MKNISSWLLPVLIYMVAAENAAAHVQLDYPVGGETFNAGGSVQIQWHITIPHDIQNWDLYFSADGGDTWEAIQLNLDPSVLKYRWPVPKIATQRARIRIDMDNTGTDYTDVSRDFTIRDTLSSIRMPEENPRAFTLLANYPNPFNPTTFIRYHLSVAGKINLTIYDQLGQEVRTLINGQQPVNDYQIQWDGRDNAGRPVVSGIYFYRLESGTLSQARRMVLLR